jgi:hypothetical protein
MAPAENPAARRGLVRRAGLALLALPLAYLVTANALLNSGVLPRLLSQRPEEILIDWDLAWSPWPGLVHVRGFYLRGQQPDLQWELSVDGGRLGVDLPGLFSQRFRATWVDAGGVEYRVRPRVASAEEAAGELAPFPPIRGLERSLQAAAAAPGPDLPWVVQLEDVTLREVRELWIGPFRSTLDSEVSGRLELRSQHLDVGPATMEIRRGEVAYGPAPVATAVSGRLELTAAIEGKLRVEALEFLRSFDAKARLAGELSSLALLSRYVPAEFEGGHAKVELAAGLAGGVFTNGSRVEVNGAESYARVGDFELRGGWHILGRVAESDGKSRASLSVQVSPLHLDDGRGSRVFETKFASASVTGSNLFLGQLPDDWRLDLDLQPTAPFPLRFLNEQIAGGRLQFASGEATVAAHVSVGPGSPEKRGSLLLRTGPFTANVGARRIHGEALVDLDLARIRLDARSLDLSGSRLELRNVVVAGAGRARPWTGRTTLESALIALEPALRAEARLAGAYSDARPFLALFGPRVQLPDWVLSLFDAKGLHARLSLEYADARLLLRQLDVTGRNVRIRGRLGVTPETVSALLLVTLYQFSAALRVRGPAVHAEFWKPDQWFARELRLFEDLAGKPQ